MLNLFQIEQKKVSALQIAFAGGFSGGVTRAITQPLDVLKIRFQLQLEPIKKGSKYSSVLQATSSIIKEEGVAALWSGHIPAQLLSVTYGILQFSTFEELIRLSQATDQNFFNTHRHAINFSCGGIAATVATIVSFPFDTVRTRLIAEQKTNKAYKSFHNAMTSMVKTEGASSLFKGLLPTLAQIAPHAGIQFAVYKLFTENILNRIEYIQRQVSVSSTISSTLVGNVLAGSVAGLVAKTAIYPFDLIKKRLQIQGFQQHREGFGQQMYCRGLLHCFKLTITQEGFLALYKGFLPSIVKAMLVTSLHFTIYDEIKHLFLKSQQ